MINYLPSPACGLPALIFCQVHSSLVMLRQLYAAARKRKVAVARRGHVRWRRGHVWRHGVAI
jgi:hypothetical protein